MMKAAIFDLGGVVVENPWPGMLRHYAAHFGIPEDTLNAAIQVWCVEWQKGALSEEEFWKRITAATGAQKEAVPNLWLQGIHAAYVERPQVQALMRSLRERGYTVALLSNTETAVVEFLNTNPVPHVDVAMYSCSMGMVKPDAEIYMAACERLGVQPHEAVFIDDKEENVLGARAVGMKGVVYTSFDEVARELEELLSHD